MDGKLLCSNMETIKIVYFEKFWRKYSYRLLINV